MDADRSHSSRLADLLDPRPWSLYYHTASNMRFVQLSGVLERKARQLLIPRLPIDFDARYERSIPDTLRSELSAVERNRRRLRGALSEASIDALKQEGTRATRGVLTQMNHPLDIAHADGIDWEDDRLTELPLFWRLKLQGFDFLRPAYLGYRSPSECPAVLLERLNVWLRDWDETTVVGRSGYLRRNWMPHSVSLRLINLARYLAWCGDHLDDADRDRFDRLLFKNARFLANHVEYDIGGNHLVENAGGLLLAGAAFRHCDVDWLETARSVLETAASQFLADGGHFERSPMYHIQCLTRYLTAVDVQRTIGLEPSPQITETARMATRYLRSIAPPDRRIPLLNDAVFDETLSLSACLSYAESVGVRTTTPTRLDASGYYWLGSDRDRMLLDGGAVGPPHLPAHSHNDLLSYLLWVDGERVVTDTGTLEYAPTPARQHARSVRAHNTVQVDSEEPIPLGGQYLMGRRLTPTALTYETDDLAVFEGAYHRPSLVGEGYRLRRRVCHREGLWLVHDQVRMPTPTTVYDRIHFHPAVELAAREDAVVASKAGTDTTVWLYPLRASDTTRTESPYFPRFGERQDRPAVELEAAGRSVDLTYILSDEQRAAVNLSDSVLRVDGAEMTVPDPRLILRT